MQGSDCWSGREEVVSVGVVKPFDVRTNLLSLQLEPLVKPFACEPLVLMPHTESLSPWPLLIHHSSLELVSYRMSLVFGWSLMIDLVCSEISIHHESLKSLGRDSWSESMIALRFFRHRACVSSTKKCGLS